MPPYYTSVGDTTLVCLPLYPFRCWSVPYASLSCTFMTLIGRKEASLRIILPVSLLGSTQPPFFFRCTVGQYSASLSITRFTVGQCPSPPFFHPFHCWAKKRASHGGLFPVLCSKGSLPGWLFPVLCPKRSLPGWVMPVYAQRGASQEGIPTYHGTWEGIHPGIYASLPGYLRTDKGRL